MYTALITGVTGQDGSYLAEFLLNKGYNVYGLQRRSSSFNTARIDQIYDKREYPNFTTFYGDLTDGSTINKIIKKIKPDEIYNLGAQSHVRVSFDTPVYTTDTNAMGTLRLLDALLENTFETRFYQASSSEMFGRVTEIPQSETTPFNPCSPYACTKVYAYWITKVYRESYKMFNCNGILFNHESPRRGETFVTRKISIGLSKIKLGLMDTLSLGNLDAKRDWGYSPEYVSGMWEMLNQDEPDDYVLATGESHSVREFVNLAFKYLDIDIRWEGEGLDEKCIDQNTGKVLINIDKNYFRPSEVDILLGDYSKAKKVLGWEPKTKFEDLVKIMVDWDYENQRKITKI